MAKRPTTVAGRAERKGGKAGNPAFEPTPEHRAVISAFAACGMPQTEMVKYVKKPDGVSICVKTLQEKFRDELDNGLEIANAKVAGKLMQAALAGNITAIIFWLKTRAKWREADKSDMPPPEEDDVEFIVRRAVRKKDGASD